MSVRWVRRSAGFTAPASLSCLAQAARVVAVTAACALAPSIAQAITPATIARLAMPRSSIPKAYRLEMESIVEFKRPFESPRDDYPTPRERAARASHRAHARGHERARHDLRRLGDGAGRHRGQHPGLVARAGAGGHRRRELVHLQGSGFRGRPGELLCAR